MTSGEALTVLPLDEWAEAKRPLPERVIGMSNLIGGLWALEKPVPTYEELCEIVDGCQAILYRITRFTKWPATYGYRPMTEPAISEFQQQYYTIPPERVMQLAVESEAMQQGLLKLGHSLNQVDPNKTGAEVAAEVQAVLLTIYNNRLRV